MNNSVVDAPVEIPGLRERKKRERREALVDATHALVREKGFDGVTIEEICARVGVSARTFFNYFRSKEDAVLGIESHEISDETAREFVTGGPTGDLMADITALVADVLERTMISADRVATAIELARQEPRLLAHHLTWIEAHSARMNELIEQRRAVQHFPYDSELLGILVMAVVRTSFLRWEASGSDGSPRDLFPRILAELRAILDDASDRP